MKLIDSDLLSREGVFTHFTEDGIGGVIMEVIFDASDRDYSLVYRIWDRVGEPGYIQMSVNVKNMTRDNIHFR